MKKLILLLTLPFLLLTCQTPEPAENTDHQETVATTADGIALDERLPKGVTRPDYGIVEPVPKEVKTPHICPPSWWVGMKSPSLEILLHDNKIADHQVSIKHAGVTVKKVSKVENPNYLFVEINIGKAQPGKFDIVLEKDGKKKAYPFELLSRSKDKKRIQGLTAADFIYLLMPDRFANGDKTNDSFDDMQQTGIRRDLMFFRHGGDLKGISNHLDYIQELGATAIWINPLLENDQPYESYHGYAITDHYEVDKRFGSNEDYVALVDKCQSLDLKIVMDIIHNHVGDQHWFFQDLPSRDWIHQYDKFTRTTYRAPTLMDPYASEYDKERMSNAWFDVHMPDLNQKNPHLAKYLIQNNIWWIEYAGIDAYRIDTYAYPDQEFMAEWAQAIKAEYPDFGLFAETWVHGTPVQAQFTQNNNLRGDYNSHMPSVTDFQLYYGINDALTKEQGWTDGIAKIYFTLAKDFLYEDPTRNVVFLDNHDLSRFYSVIGEDINKYKSGITFLLTTRGTPMLYYGTEILMKNFTDPDGKVREDFSGGWEGDPANKFTKEGRTEQENEAFNYVAKLANYRKENAVLQTGKLMQFVPENGIYVYFRYNDNKTVMVAMNTHENRAKVALDRFKERLGDRKQMKDVFTGDNVVLTDSLGIDGFSTRVLEF